MFRKRKKVRVRPYDKKDGTRVSGHIKEVVNERTEFNSGNAKEHEKLATNKAELLKQKRKNARYERKVARIDARTQKIKSKGARRAMKANKRLYKAQKRQKKIERKFG